MPKTLVYTDLRAGFFVSLIALPLCLGIAMASGFPPMSGLITAIIGGLLVSRIGGTQLTINGPAAGLIVVVLDSVLTLGEGNTTAGVAYTLAAIVLSGLIQIALGALRAGKLSAFFPSSVVHGMLAAIGIIILIKQSYVLLGVPAETGSILQQAIAIPKAISHLNVPIAMIGLTGLAVMIFWPRLPFRFSRTLPAPLWVLCSGLLLTYHFDLDQVHRYHFAVTQFLAQSEFLIGPDFLLNLPNNPMDALYFPDFALIGTVKFWFCVFNITLIGSLETLLSAAAVDKLDPQHRCSDLNRDLMAIGMGNTLCGLVGGLPMIAEIVRSSSNISYGAQSGWANFYHSVFLLLFISLGSDLIQQIPLASLAALLVYTGFRLASPMEFAKTLSIGFGHFLVFIITLISILLTDLLLGVLIGIVSELALHGLRGLKLAQIFQAAYRIEEQEPGNFHVLVHGAAVFSNFIALKSMTGTLPKGRQVIFDLSEANLIDSTVLEFIYHFRAEYRRAGGICEIVGLQQHHAVAKHPLSVRRTLRV
ncbi:SulP family inorganic anion transporter [Methylicorpusculum oleiharenae]|uniref:SulP family inorganic anion transporter n=1 Tax=Methylicorpusculum oleiharenae TaxID=1338687 RepID=UPI001E4F49B2|nr:SulP family inorganic anion transporter [Methylicorpusculum oleiharenae]MCD2450763.1 SulP family inorganic anion transporter [Methylicorpusculum oleiharenae]